MPQTGSEGRGLKLVKIQLVGGELAARRWKEMAGPRDPVPKVSWLEHQAGEGQRWLFMGTQASTSPRRRHVLS